MLGNLIANAIQHGDQTNPVTVSANADSQEIVLSVHNNGGPISQSELHTIFYPFTRRGKKDTPTTHLGLGLFVAREIVEAHSGKISVISTAQDGTTFVVRLPR
jgi:signal transduction histidine kinase